MGKAGQGLVQLALELADAGGREALRHSIVSRTPKVRALPDHPRPSPPSRSCQRAAIAPCPASRHSLHQCGVGATHGGCCKTSPSAVFEHDLREKILTRNPLRQWHIFRGARFWKFCDSLHASPMSPATSRLHGDAIAIRSRHHHGPPSPHARHHRPHRTNASCRCWGHGAHDITSRGNAACGRTVVTARPAPMGGEGRRMEVVAKLGRPRFVRLLHPKKSAQGTDSAGGTFFEARVFGGSATASATYPYDNSTRPYDRTRSLGRTSEASAPSSRLLASLVALKEHGGESTVAVPRYP